MLNICNCIQMVPLLLFKSLMKNVITIRDVAKKAGVSETTVSLSFQPDSRISRRTREHVLQVAYELKYVKNSVAQNLRGGRTKTIGFIVNDINDAFYNIMSREASNIANRHGFQVLYAETGWSPDKAIDITKMMIAKRVEGLMLSLCEKEDESLELIQHMNTPYVVIDTKPANYDGPYVINDETTIGKITAKHLVDIGCRKVAFFNASREMATFSAFDMQLKGIRTVLHERNIPFDSSNVYFSGLTISDGAETFRRMMNTSGLLYDGIICANDYVAYGVIDEAEKMGIKVGEDLALIGIDNLEYSSLRRISLTSVDIDYRLMTAIAIENLIGTIENKTKSSIRHILEPRLVVRNSTSKFFGR